MKQLQRRFILLFVSLAFGFFVIFTFMAINTFGNQYDQMHQGQLEDQVYFISDSIQRAMDQQGEEGTASFIQEVRSAFEHANLRATLITKDGQVLYDSDFPADEMDNHLERPEVQKVLNGQDIAFSKRKSDTTGERYLYAATVIDDNVSQPLILRLADPTVFFDSLFRVFLVGLLAFVIFAVLLIFIISHILSRNLFQPLEEIKEVAQRVSHQDFSMTYTGQSYEEVQELGASINELSNNLESQLEELEQSNLRLRSLIENINIGVMLIDNERSIQLSNPAMNQILQVAISTQTDEKYIYYIKNPWIVELIEDGYRTKERQSREIIFQSNEERIIDATVLPNTDDEGELNNIILLLYDITEIRRLEKVRTDFVANASHELRTPVTALKGFTETLLDGALEDRDTLIEFLEIIHKESIRLDSIVGDVLQLSKLENQSFTFERQSILVADVVQEVFQIVRETAEAKRIGLEMNDPQSVVMNYDQDILKQILLNLVHNAVLYTGEDGKVQVDISKTKDHVTLQVKDTGMGIPDKDQKRIFERFYRVDKGRSRNSGGTGLGLSIVKHMVENSKGTIELHSKYGMGSNFIVRIPDGLTESKEKDL